MRCIFQHVQVVVFLIPYLLHLPYNPLKFGVAVQAVQVCIGLGMFVVRVTVCYSLSKHLQSLFLPILQGHDACQVVGNVPVCLLHIRYPPALGRRIVEISGHVLLQCLQTLGGEVRDGIAVGNESLVGTMHHIARYVATLHKRAVLYGTEICGHAYAGEGDVGERRTVGGNGLSACGEHYAAEYNAAKPGTGVAKPSVHVIECAVDDDFLESRYIFEDMIGQKFHIMHLECAQVAAVAKTVLPQLYQMLRKFHLREFVATVECPSHDDGLLRYTDAAQCGIFKGSDADGVHTFGKNDLFQPTTAEGKWWKCQCTALYALAFIFKYIGFAAGREDGAAEVERAQTAFGGLLAEVASCHFAQETEVRTVEGTFDSKTGQFVFLPFTHQFRESARCADKYVARFCVGIAAAEEEKKE